MSYAVQKKNGNELNRMYVEDKSIHDWYRFVLSYPPHLVRHYVEKFNLQPNQTLLDPFAGTGTSLVEAKKLGVKSIGIEANPVAQMAASVKVNWSLNADLLIAKAKKIAAKANEEILSLGTALLTLEPEKEKLLITNSISPIPLHKSLALMRIISTYVSDEYYDYFRIALAKVLVFDVSNLHFGPEVGVSRKKKLDAPVVDLWLEQVKNIAADICEYSELAGIDSKILLGDARDMSRIIEPKSIDAVITSPPYPNEKDYTRTTRLESVILGFMNNKDELRKSKKRLLRSNTKNVYKGDDDNLWIESNVRIRELSELIEQTRITLGKTSGFEKLYHKVIKLYFGGMAKHLEDLKPLLKNGAQLAYVVGDQASYFRLHIQTGEILAQIAADLGYEVIGLDLFRTRLATATKSQLREEVLLLKWNG